MRFVLMLALALALGCRPSPTPSSAGPVASPVKKVVLPSTAPAASAAAQPDCDKWKSAKLTLRRESCFGPCPLYTLTVHGSGAVAYAGERYVRERGKRTAHVDPTAVCLLLERAAESFRQYRSYEGSLSKCKDEDTATLFLEVSEDFAVAELHFTADPVCRPKGFPSDVIELANAIDALTTSATWVRCVDGAGKRVRCKE